MGQLLVPGSRRDVIRSLLEPREVTMEDAVKSLRAPYKLAPIASCYRGAIWKGCLWSVWEVTFLSGEQQTIRELRCDTLQYQVETGLHLPGWWVQSFSEIDAPYHYTCPLKYLILADPVKYRVHFDLEWRAVVRQHHAKRRERQKKKAAADCVSR